MSRAGVLAVFVAVVLAAGCYYDQASPDLGKAGTPEYITNKVSIEMVQQPIKFKFSIDQDVTEPDVTEDTAGQPCGGKDCEAEGKVCHPTADVCVECYVDSGAEVDPGCEEGWACYVIDVDDPATNTCVAL